MLEDFKDFARLHNPKSYTCVNSLYFTMMPYSSWPCIYCITLVRRSGKAWSSRYHEGRCSCFQGTCTLKGVHIVHMPNCCLRKTLIIDTIFVLFENLAFFCPRELQWVKLQGRSPYPSLRKDLTEQDPNI